MQHVIYRRNINRYLYNLKEKERGMKKIKKSLFVLLITVSVFAYAKPSTVTLDAAIKEASKEINSSLPAGTKVALLNFSSDSDAFSDYVIEEMSIALVRGKKLVIVDRKEIELIRKEMDFQMSGDVSDESAQQIGAMLGAQSIISGSMVNVGDGYRFRTKVINVISAAIQTSSSINVKSDKQVTYLLSQGKKAPAPQATPVAATTGGTQAAPAQAQPAAPAAVTYKVGDTGPAGGLIFYDKGNNNGGWRYLEVAPSDINRQLSAASEYIKTTDCAERAVGKGKPNTQAIMKEAANKGGGFGWAAQACDTYTLNGFDDWFLPSRDELHYMYGNLHMNGLGDFRNELYWSSTAYNDASFWYEDFSNGKQDYVYLNISKAYRVRPIRQF
jgi:TolB-like protein